jgi:hypothetical protein
MLLYFKLHSYLTRVEIFLLKARSTLGMSLVTPEAYPPAENNIDSGDIMSFYGSFLPPLLSLAHCCSPMCRLLLRVRTSLVLDPQR